MFVIISILFISFSSFLIYNFHDIVYINTMNPKTINLNRFKKQAHNHGQVIKLLDSNEQKLKNTRYNHEIKLGELKDIISRLTY